MFTGIIEDLGKIKDIRTEGTNVHFTVHSKITPELKIDQSLAHNGVCLTVVAIEGHQYTVTAIKETLDRSNLGQLQVDDVVNLERAMLGHSRLDGHIVQGHVDATATCVSVKEVDGSWYYSFQYKPTPDHLLVDKGSVCINGVSLTVVEPVDDHFSVAIIPYTYEHTTFHTFRPGSTVNLEFDILGKYIAKYAALYMK
ncbi:MAG: riboflavin synthase [Saprospiraceae bacterium]